MKNLIHLLKELEAAAYQHQVRRYARRIIRLAYEGK